jgi:hypothetical protein
MTTQPSMTTSSTAPWQGKEVGYGARLGLTLVSAIVLIIAIVSFFIAFGVSMSLLRGTALPDSTTTSIITVVIVIGVCIGSVGGLVMLWPYTRGPARFTPSYGQVPVTTLAHPFEVRFQRYLWGRSMRGKGTVQFTPESLVVAGHVEPHALFQLGIVLVVTILPLVLFGFGLGIIPALIIAYYVGRRRVERSIPYAELRGLEIKGRVVTVRATGSPGVITFAAAHTDGERLYRELLLRFPAALGGWQG